MSKSAEQKAIEYNLSIQKKKKKMGVLGLEDFLSFWDGVKQK